MPAAEEKITRLKKKQSELKKGKVEKPPRDIYWGGGLEAGRRRQKKKKERRE